MIVKKTGLAILLCMLIPLSGYCEKEHIRIVTDESYWYPYTFVQDGRAKGIHIEIAEKAIINLNYRVTFYPKPWKRSLEDIKNGEYDAIVSASYKPDRAQYLIYPEDAATSPKSRYRITQVEYVVITNQNDGYLFNGDVKTLPQPVRAPLGYSIAADLKSAGAEVLEVPDITACIVQLVNSGRGSFVSPPENALRLELDTRFKGKLKIHPDPIGSKSYFMAFAKTNQKLSLETIKAVWDEIAKLREDNRFMDALFNKYQGPK